MDLVIIIAILAFLNLFLIGCGLLAWGAWQVIRSLTEGIG